MIHTKIAQLSFLITLFFVQATHATDLNGQPENQIDSLGYYYGITGGQFPTGTVPNGDNASGGTFRFLLDDPAWGRPLNQWHKDDWFPENAGLALTLYNNGTIVYDNNGIEDGSGAHFYDYANHQPVDDWNTPGLYRGYCMSNNYDWIYATYIKLDQETTFDKIVGYFDPTNGFDPQFPLFGYRMNLWSAEQDNLIANPNSYIPSVVSFTGDVFSSDNVPGVFSVSQTNVKRIFPSWSDREDDQIWRLVYELNSPVTLPAGVYFFSHDAIITDCISVSPNLVKVNDPIQITAVIDIGENDGTDLLMNVEYSFDGITWIPDPSFDPSSLAEYVAEINTFAPSDAGVYTVCVKGEGTIDGEPVEQKCCTMLVVYDPTGGFVTGGGWIDSPPGAYKPSDHNVLSTVWDQGFEVDTSGWLDSANGWVGTISQVASGHNGIISSKGSFHAIVDQQGSSAPFSSFDGFRNTWLGTWIAEIDVYLDPDWQAGTGFDYSVAASGSDGAHQRDYIFHVTKDTSTGQLLVAGSNNTNFAPREDLETINNYKVASAGWYTLQHVFYESSGALAVDLNLLDSNGNVLFTETRFNPADLIPSEVGGNRYAWFTFINVPGGIAIDEHQLYFRSSLAVKPTSVLSLNTRREHPSPPVRPNLYFKPPVSISTVPTMNGWWSIKAAPMPSSKVREPSTARVFINSCCGRAMVNLTPSESKSGTKTTGLRSLCMITVPTSPSAAETSSSTKANESL